MSHSITDVFIGTTLRPESDTVVEGGVELARALEARVHLVHALAPRPTVAEHEEGVRRIRGQARRLGLGQPELAGIAVEDRPPHELLLDAGRRPGAMVVVGRRRSPRILSQLAGSTTQRVAGSASCPVAVVHGALRLPPDRVLVACDPAARDPHLTPSFALIDAIDPGRTAQIVALATITYHGRAAGGSLWSKADRKTLAMLHAGVSQCPGAAGRRVTPQVVVGRRLASISRAPASSSRISSGPPPGRPGPAGGRRALADQAAPAPRFGQSPGAPGSRAGSREPGREGGAGDRRRRIVASLTERKAQMSDWKEHATIAC